MASTTSCAQCGLSVPPDAPAGHCPNCLLGVADERPASEGSSPRATLPSRDRRFGDYVLGRQLGSGGMGIVYEARQVSLHRQVAVKFIRDSEVASPLLLRRFTIEAEATARLHHPNIVGIHEIGEVDGQPFFSMNLVEGESLRARLANGELTIQKEAGANGRSQQVVIARLIAKTARALHHAHQRGVLHRDLKPANILLDKNGEPHLTDFGLAKILRQTTERETRQSLTGTGDITGTPSYMSPEQASSAETTGASDIYSLGAVLYELLTGRPPFRAHTALETIKQVQEQPPRSPRSVNRLIEKDLETICAKCLEKDPRHRYSSAEALADDLENWIDRKPIKARPAGPLLRARQWTKRNRAGAALIVALFLGLAGALVLLQVVNHQKEKFEMQQALLFDEKVKQLYRHWRDPANRHLTIPSEALAILGNRTPAHDPAARRLSLGCRIHNDPINFAQHISDIWAELEPKLEKALREPVQVDLILFKSDVTETDILAQGQVDFMCVEATFYLTAKRLQPGLVSVARMKSEVTAVLAAHPKAGVKQLKQLAGKAIVFSGPDDSSTAWAKARLADAGVLRKQLKALTNLFSQLSSAQEPGTAGVSPRVAGRWIVNALMLRQADVGTLYLRRYQSERQKGLVQLDRFTSTPRVFAARQGLATNLVAAFRTALCRVKGRAPDDRVRSGGNPSDWEEAFPGAVPMDDSFLDGLREAMRKAARFDGEPDPFPPDQPPPASRMRSNSSRR